MQCETGDNMPVWGLLPAFVNGTSGHNYNADSVAKNFKDSPGVSMWASGQSACCVAWGSSNPKSRDCYDWSLGIGLDRIKCNSCGAKMLSVFTWQSESRWVVAKWGAEYKWQARAMENINTWITSYPNYAALMGFYELAAMQVRTYPTKKYISCRTQVRFQTMNSLANGRVEAIKLGEATNYEDTETRDDFSD
jgi:hypothetical protein